MNRRLMTLPAAALLAVLVAACGSSSATSTPTTASAPSTVPSTSASESATESASASSSASAAAVESPTDNVAGVSGSAEPSLALPSFDLHGAADLEAAIPGSVNGRTLTKASFSMAQLSALSGGSDSSSDKTFLAWLQALGKSPSDVNVAVGIAQGTPALTIGAIRISGADQNQLLSTFLAASKNEQMTVTQSTLGGKQVAKIADATNTGSSPSYVYAKGDILYYVQADDDTTPGQALTALP